MCICTGCEYENQILTAPPVRWTWSLCKPTQSQHHHILIIIITINLQLFNKKFPHHYPHITTPPSTPSSSPSPTTSPAARSPRQSLSTPSSCLLASSSWSQSKRWRGAAKKRIKIINWPFGSNMPDLKLHPLLVTTTYTSFVLTDASEWMNKVNDALIFSLHSTIEWPNMW